MHRRAELLPILHPLFNLREICKQLTLLEDHLNQPQKRCSDCIRKHFLTIEAFFEEAVSLGKPNAMLGSMPLANFCQMQADVIRGLSEQWVDGTPEEEIAAALRPIRKGLMPYCFDMRTMRTASTKLVADRWSARVEPCVHRVGALRST
jgi:hypothetical protein